MKAMRFVSFVAALFMTGSCLPPPPRPAAVVAAVPRAALVQSPSAKPQTADTSFVQLPSASANLPSVRLPPVLLPAARPSSAARPLLSMAMAASEPSAEKLSPATPTVQASIRSNLEVDLMSRLSGTSTNSSSKLRRIATLPTTRGTSLVRLKQMIDGYELYNGGLTAHVDAQETVMYALSMSGGLYVGRSIGGGSLPPPPPKVTAEMALKATAAAFRITARELQSNAWQKTARLMLYPSPASKAAPTLCYLVEFYVVRSGSGPSSPHAIVNATDGTIVDKWNGMATATVPISMTGVGGNGGAAWGQQSYSDIPATSLNGVNCSYYSSSVRVQNLRGATSSSTFVDAVCPCSQANNATYDSTNGGYAPLNDLARHGKAVVDMFDAYLGTSPSASLPLLIRAHYGSGYENAFWDSLQVNVGDGKNNFFPLTSADVIGHEFAHSFTALCSGLQYSGQAGGINEAFSDMAGETTEYFLYGSADYIVGRQITKSGAGIRYMCNPTKDGRSIDNAANFTPTMDPHYSSGIFNKVFCNLSKTANWDIPTAFTIFAYANYACWQQLSTFTQAACCVQQAAYAYSLSTADVASAFATVGISVACS